MVAAKSEIELLK